MKTWEHAIFAWGLCLACSSPALAEALIRVGIAEGMPRIELSFQNHFSVFQDDNLLFRSETATGSLKLPDERFTGSLRIVTEKDAPIGYNHRLYRGEMLLVPTEDTWTLVNRLPIETYLRGVLGEEMSANWPIEALKAQAVAARTFAYSHLNQYPQKPFDLYNTVKDQVYGGMSSESTASFEAVNATKGEILTYRGTPIQACFCDSTGGHTENSADVWSQNLPYLRGVPDYDQSAPRYLWQRVVTLKELQPIADVGDILAIDPIVLSPTGRIKQIRITGSNGTKVIPGTQFRMALKLYSTQFSIVPSDKGFFIVGRGYGHGVGMSQWGAKTMAEAGARYDRILAHYYRNTTLEITKTSRSDPLF